MINYLKKTTMIKRNVFKVLFISLMFSFAACSSDDNPNDDNGGTIGSNHTYDIELVGESETIEVSGSIPNHPEDDDENIFSVAAVYGANPEADDDSIMITMTISNTNTSEAIYGVFMLDSNRQALYPLANPDDIDDNVTGLVIIPAGSSTEYESIAGTLNFSNVKLASTTIVTGVSSFTLNFSGDFVDGDDNIYQGSGTIVISPLVGLNYN